MGNSTPKPLPEAPKKTIKEMTKEFSKQIRKLQREFGREKGKLEMNNKKIMSDLDRMAKKKESKSAMRILAVNIPRNNNYITRYSRLDAQMNDIMFQMNSASSTEVMVGVMKEMNSIMKTSNQSLDVKNVMQVMEQFNMQMEKQGMMQGTSLIFLLEQMQDVMAQDDEDVMDEDVDKIIRQVEEKSEGGQGGQLVNNQAMQAAPQDEFSARIDALGQ